MLQSNVSNLESFAGPTVSIEQVERMLDELLPSAEAPPQPLHRAMRHAVFAGGKRLRPRLLLAVAHACHPGPLKAGETALLLRTACAAEFIHAASLVHDDLPCFDNAMERRGQPSIHRRYGEPLAILVGDALLCIAFASLANVPEELAGRALRISRLLGAATSSQAGIIGGQSIEQGGCSFPSARAAAGTPYAAGRSEYADIVERYHAMKSAALFQLVAEAGALTVGAAHVADWAEVGHSFGLIYQLIDDLYDCCGVPGADGKPVQRDANLGRLNAVLVRGENKARQDLLSLWNHARNLAFLRAVNKSNLAELFDMLRAHMEHVVSKPDSFQLI